MWELHSRQVHREAGSFVGTAAHLDSSPMLIDDPFHRAQTEPDAVDRLCTRRIGAKETLEDMGLRGGGYAFAGVLDLYCRLRMVAGRTHTNPSAFGRVLDRVVEQVQYR